MKISLAHHYWQNKANATWNPARFPCPAIEDAIKQNYVALETERPVWRRYGDITVIFDYRPTKDIYGRDIVPISFAFVPGRLISEKCRCQIAKILARTPETVTEIEAPDGCLAKASHRVMPVLAGAAALALIAAGFWLVGGAEKQEAMVPEAAPAMAEQNVAKPALALPESDAAKLEAHSPVRETKAEAEYGHTQTEQFSEADLNETQDAFSHLCGQRELRKKMNNCAGAYFAEYCGKRLEKGLNFEKWKALTKAKMCARGEDKKIFKRGQEPDRKTIKEMERIFDGR